MTYLDSITLVRTIPCLAEPGKIIVVGKPSRTLEEVLPYLATLPGVLAWNPRAIALTFRRQPGFLTLQRDQIFFIQVKDVDEGLSLLGSLRDAINAVWEKRDDLVAVTNFETCSKPPGYLGASTPHQLRPMRGSHLSGVCGGSDTAKTDAGRMSDSHSDPEFADRRVALDAIL